MPIKFRYVEGVVIRNGVNVNGALWTIDIRTADGSIVTVYTNSWRNQKMIDNWYGGVGSLPGARVRFQISDTDEIIGVG